MCEGGCNCNKAQEVNCESSDYMWQWVYNKPKFNKDGKSNCHRRRVGFLIAQKDATNQIEIGWSRCASHDTFDLQLAKEIAIGRLHTGTDTPLPSTFRSIMPEFLFRCKRYFRSDDIQEFSFSDMEKN